MERLLMCLKTPKVPEPAKPVPAPQRRDVDTGTERRKIANRQGVFANILTSPLGDSSYGMNAQKMATLGA
jgi:hypothetical protein